ncbi:Trk system potassium transporter TrkA [Desulfovibrio inopinatus]|uniref:Trk system potassium transporter TrkA n=1 Tax=Desulfovibrio inopinatus TaxID=102109 RepID=UPI00041B057F|nr:Trk system potassium transporter TrkA [Desulfovibrio inopinatus]
MRIVIVGAGEVGFHLAERFSRENKDVVVIDLSGVALKRVSENLDVQTIKGSGSSPRVLKDAGITGAEVLLAVTNSDEINLIACFFANELSPQTRKIVRIRNDEYTDFKGALAKDLLNISMVINPDVEVVNSILRIIEAPGAVEVKDFADGRVKMIGVPLPEGSEFDGMKLMHLREHLDGLHIIIAAIIRDDRLIIPKGSDRLRSGDLIYLVCQAGDLLESLKLFGARGQSIRNVLIIGGGKIGYLLAKALDSRSINTKIIDMEPRRGDFLSSELDKAIVLLGDGTDHELLQEENIADMDLVVALTGDEETNILSCLLAKRLGAAKTITRINKFAYMPLVKAIGVNHIVSPRLSAINSILHNIRKGKVISAVSIKNDEAEVLEAEALSSSVLVGRPLKDLSLNKVALLVCIIRGESVIIPMGETVIKPKDHLIILSTQKNIPRVEQFLAGQAES